MKIQPRRYAALSLVACATLMATQAQAGVVRLSPSTKAVDAVFQRYDNRESPGCSVAIVDNGKVLYQKSYGMADVALGVARTEATSHWLPYSEARVFVALAVAMLARDGKLDLDDPVRGHVPEVPAYASAVTVRQLLHHTSGLADYGVLAPAFRPMETPVSEDEMFRVLARWGKLGFEPGQGRMYSNTDYGLLKILVERKSGGSLHDYLYERLFKPLGMEATRMGASQAPVYPGHALFNEAPAAGGGRVLGYRRTPTGGISVTTNLEDLVRWDAALRDPALGLAAMLKSLEAGAPPAEADAGEEGFAFGLFRRTYRGIPVVAFHGVGEYTYLVQVPGTALSVANLCNVYPGMDSFALDVARLYVGPAGEPAVQDVTVGEAPETPIVPGPPVQMTPAELQVYAGEYRNASGSFKATINAVDGGLQFTPESRPPMPLLVPVGNGQFTTELEGSIFVVTFKGDEGDMVLSAWDITTNSSGGDDLLRWTPPPAPTDEVAATYAGTYVGEDIDAVIYVRADGNRVLAATRGMGEEALEPTEEADQFKGPDVYTTRFERDQSGKVVALVLDATRVKGMRYKLR